VIPGYLPLKLNIAQSMTSGTDLGAYVSYLCQAADGYSMEYNFSDPQGITYPLNMHNVRLFPGK